MEININVGTYDGKLLGFSLNDEFSANNTLYSFPASTSLIKTTYQNGRYLFIGGSEELIKVYDVRRRVEVTLLEQHNGTITQIAGHSNFLFTAAEDGKVNLWRNKQWAILNTFQCGSPVICIAIHESGKILACATKDQKLHLYNLMNLKRIALKKFHFNIDKIHFISKEDEIQYLLFQSDRKCYIVDCETNKVAHTIDFTAQITDSILNQNSLILSDANGIVYMIKLTVDNQIQSQILVKFVAHQKRIKQLQLFDLNDQTYLASISSDGDIKIWDCLLYANEQYDDIDLKNKLKPIYVIRTNQRLTCFCVSVVQRRGADQEQEQTQVQKPVVVPIAKQIKKQLVNKKPKQIQQKTGVQKVQKKIQKKKVNVLSYIMNPILQSVLNSPQYSRSIPKKQHQFASIYRVPTKYKAKSWKPQIEREKSEDNLVDQLRPNIRIRLPSLQHQDSSGSHQQMIPRESEKEKKIEITTKVMYYLSRMTGPENASKSKKYREKEIQSRLMPGVNSYDGLYDEMYEDDDN
ncbi:unnamed protein product (macronuclear) [Paramecium tetraurelia]|uniref:TEP-1 C-terminal beta-propeller domain-containing protein n=1 Tax=Paramecium tetraurelia TaxID=5888 RepID=A0CT75_PARTE|nr:uncharacterized protein GSPATT00010226001 [Paramecium tetraurelia]CAK73992.1 unnamed protein product [Paramecium tetraurelia]|eukprot:XP_001441389.1 hypothetical protein (macronuclear) [Paramecium tetraurelia strain d4-2]